MNAKYDIIIIGGGLGGLSSGALLAKKGKKVLLLEQHYIPGGCATTFKRKDFVMEVGLHEMDGMDKLDGKTKVLEDLDIFNNIELLKLPEFYRYKNSKIDISVPDNTEDAITVLCEAFPHEKKGIKKFFRVIHKIRKEVYYLPKYNWQRMLLFPLFPVLYPYLTVSSSLFLKLIGLTNPLFWLKTPHLAFWKYRTIGDLLDGIIKDEDLKKVLLANLTYYHDDPHTLSLIFYSVAQGGYFKGGGYFIKGGSQNLSDYFVSIIKKNGGEMRLGKKVTDIIVENNRATGVEYKDAFNASFPSQRADSTVVIGNAAPQLIAEMLPANYRDKLIDKFKNLKIACSLLSVYIGFKKEIKTLGNKAYSTIIAGEGIHTSKDIFANHSKSWDKKGFVFVDYSQIDAGLTPPGKSFGCITSADYISNWENLTEEEYKEEKEKVAQVLIDRLEKHIPGIKNEIEYYEVATAKTIQNYTSNPQGTAYGFAQIPEQAGAKRLIIEHSPVQGVYFSSAWAFPGGGFTGAILSGINTYDKLKNLQPTNSFTPIEKDNRIVKLIDKQIIAENTLEITLEKPSRFISRAGQYAVIDLMKDYRTVPDISIRPLSIVAHPDEDTIKFAMRLSDSPYKKSLEKLKHGSEVRVFGPMGDFHVSAGNKGVVFLVSGIGITPVVPIIKELKKQDFQEKIYLFYSNKTEESTAYHSIFTNEKSTLFEYIPVFTRKEDRINEDFLKAKLKKLKQFDYFIVGTREFLKSMKSILLSNNVSGDNIEVDDFG